MDNYPRLSEMGVLHPEHISKYSVNSIDYVDYLRIFYDRPKGSLLPVTRNYQFPRKQKEVPAGSSGDRVVMESSPEFREAIAELEQVIAQREAPDVLADQMLAELRELEDDVAHHAACLQALIQKIAQAKSAAK